MYVREFPAYYYLSFTSGGCNDDLLPDKGRLLGGVDGNPIIARSTVGSYLQTVQYLVMCVWCVADA